MPRALLTPGLPVRGDPQDEGDPGRSVVLLTRWDSPPRFEEGWVDGEVLVAARASHYETV